MISEQLLPTTSQNPYARALAASKRARWDLERDALRGRRLAPTEKFLPDGLSRVQTLEFLSEAERRFLGQIQGRTYANIFGLVERYINAKILAVSARHHLGDQTALEALVRFSDEELKHQELFRRMEQLCADVMPAGYRFEPKPNEVASFVLGKSTWAVLALTCHIELFTLAHYTESIAPDEQLSPLFKDVLRFHWMEESQHAVLDELEWRAEDARIDVAQRAAALTDLIELVAAIDGILQAQSAADASYFITRAGPTFSADQAARVRDTLLSAYRYQYIGSGLSRTGFVRILSGLISAPELARVTSALAPLL
jgi:hypothetical protein